MTFLARSIAPVLLTLFFALLLPAAASAAVTCVNGQLVADDGSVTGTCDGSAPAAPDPTAGDSAATVDFSNTFAFQRQGIFGCSLNGSYSMSVGALGATGGAYVPVNDASVTLNTGYLVYKECVLRGVVDREREYATASFQKQFLTPYISGRNGQPYYSQNISAEQNDVRLRSYVDGLSGGLLTKVDPAIRPAVQNAIAKGFASAYNQPYDVFDCPYNGNLSSVIAGNPDGSFWDGYDAAMRTSCNPYYLYLRANARLEQNAQSDVNNMMTQLLWGRGTYPRTTVDPVTGETIVVTPAAVVQSNALMALQTGFYQLQNANDIDQMVGALFAGITSQVLSDSRGLAGLIERAGSKPSYLDQVVSESQLGLRNSAVNAAIQILTASRQIEAAYKAAMEAIGTTLLNTMSQLRAQEATCWNRIVDRVCSSELSSDNTCTAKVTCSATSTPGQTCRSGVKLKVATSTEHSQQVIDSQITPLASSTAINIQASAKALALIGDLVKSVTNTGALDAQRIALQQLDVLVSQKALHTQYDMQAAKEQQKDLASSMATLIQDTAQAWGDSSDPETGWCNYNNPSVLNMWRDAWKTN